MPEPGGSMFDIRPAEARAAGEAVGDVAQRAREIDLHAPLNALAAALPGGSAAPAARGCKIAGREGIRGWTNRVQRHGANLRGAGEDYEQTDTDARGRLITSQLDNEGER